MRSRTELQQCFACYASAAFQAYMACERIESATLAGAAAGYDLHPTQGTLAVSHVVEVLNRNASR